MNTGQPEGRGDYLLREKLEAVWVWDRLPVVFCMGDGLEQLEILRQSVLTWEMLLLRRFRRLEANKRFKGVSDTINMI